MTVAASCSDALHAASNYTTLPAVVVAKYNLVANKPYHRWHHTRRCHFADSSSSPLSLTSTFQPTLGHPSLLLRRKWFFFFLFCSNFLHLTTHSYICISVSVYLDVFICRIALLCAALFSFYCYSIAHFVVVNVFLALCLLLLLLLLLPQPSFGFS